MFDDTSSKGSKSEGWLEPLEIIWDCDHELGSNNFVFIFLLLTFFVKLPH